MIKRLAACIREYKRPTILTPVCMVGEVVCECTIPLLTADLINAIQNGCTMQTILSFGLKLFVIAMLSLGFGSLSAGSRQRPRRALRRICGMICIIRCRAFPLRTSTGFRPRRSSRG